MNKYRVFLFMAIAKSLKDKSLTLTYSYRYRQTPSYMISPEEWHNHRERLLAASSLDKFTESKPTLDGIGQQVTKRLYEVSARIKNDAPPFFST